MLGVIPFDGGTVSPVNTVVLGPDIDLHDGVHGSLIETPPAGFCYSIRPATHFFPFPERGRRQPHKYFHLGEYVDFGPGPELVHSSRWPVLNRHAWVADMDDFGYPALGGRHLMNPDFRQNLREPGATLTQGRIVERMKCMLTMYAHPSCRAILFRTQQAVGVARNQLLSLGAGALGEAFLRKVSVLYPAQKVCAPGQVKEKWRGTPERRVVFCGRDYEVKQGLLALRLFHELAPKMPHVRFIYIGEVPPSYVPDDCLSNVEILGEMSRRQVLEVFAAGHILFHPSKFESVGIVLLEAAAAGMAIIAATGGEMSHMDELFRGGGALLVNRTALRLEQEESAFRRCLEQLLTDPQLASRMGLHNHYVSTEGYLSIPERNAILASVYQRALEERTEPLTTGMLPKVPEGSVWPMESRMVLQDQLNYMHELGIARRHVNILV
jgi:glycosyltransferase involved in cell wall biosynthesis